MRKVEDLGGLARRLRRARLPGVELVKRVRKQGGRLTPQARKAAEGGLVTDKQRAQFYNETLVGTSETNNHFAGSKGQRYLRDSERNFNVRFKGSKE